MKFLETDFQGLFVIELEFLKDSRGHFARSFCVNEFHDHGLKTDFVQHNVSYNQKKGTLRGMHYQLKPHEEVKVVRCTKGKVFDVVVDLRPESKTYKKWLGFELDETNAKMLYIPEGFAHGFQTLQDETEVFYLMGSSYHPESARGFSWNDSKINIEWPMEESRIMSEKDASYTEFQD